MLPGIWFTCSERQNFITYIYYIASILLFVLVRNNIDLERPIISVHFILGDITICYIHFDLCVNEQRVVEGPWY